MDSAVRFRRRLARSGVAGFLLVLGLLAIPSPAAAATLELSATDATIGETIEATAVLSNGVEPTGTISFEVFPPSDPGCELPPLTPGPPAATVSGDGSYPSGPFTPEGAGVYHWSAHYSGDPNNPAVDLDCVASSTVAKATPALAGTASASVLVGTAINDSATLSGGLEPSGQLLFRAFGPADPTCANPPAYEEAVAVDGNGTYAPAGFKPDPGLYLWTVTYAGDEENAAAELGCGSANQASAVGILNVTLAASAGTAAVGGSLTATATLGSGVSPGGQLTFKAFPPSDTACSGPAAFSSSVAVSGNGTYSSAAFSPAQVGTFRWTIAYSGDPNHAAAGVACGAASSPVVKAVPTVAGRVGKRLKVGTKFRDAVTLSGGFSPGGTITFQIYGPGGSADRCEKPAFTNTIRIKGNGVWHSDPFVAKQAGRYRFLAVYSGDAANQPASETCANPEQLAQVRKRVPRLRPLASLAGPQQISIRARLSGASSPTGLITYRLFAPGDRRCSGRPALSGALRVKRNGTFRLAEYLATKPGQYRLAVGYSGDLRNAGSRISCKGTRLITVRA